METSLKSGITLNEDAYIIITDLHLNEKPIDETDELIKLLKSHRQYSIVLLGDTFQSSRDVAIENNKDLIKEINKHHPTYICGDTDPYFGYDYAEFHNRILCHGNQFNIFTRFKLLNKLLKKFKHDFENIKHDIPLDIRFFLGNNHYVIGHYNNDCNIVGSRCLAARTPYLMDSEKIIKL